MALEHVGRRRCLKWAPYSSRETPAARRDTLGKTESWEHDVQVNGAQQSHDVSDDPFIAIIPKSPFQGDYPEGIAWPKAPAFRQCLTGTALCYPCLEHNHLR